MRILITGADGFVGSRLKPLLISSGHEVAGTSRAGREEFRCDVGAEDGWDEAMAGREVVVHLAARVHQMADQSVNPLEAFREINLEGSLRVARAAVAAGVRRFVFLSTIKVLGERTAVGHPFTSSSKPKPEDPYAISKAEAEDALFEINDSGTMEVVVIRPPLVFGPNVKGNLVALARSIRRGIPFPFGGIKNRRDLVGVDNLCDLIGNCVESERAPGNRFLVADGKAVSTAELVREIGVAMGQRARMLWVPRWCLAGGLRLIGKRGVWERLAGNLEIDVSETKRVLGWDPKVSFEEGIARAFGSL